MQTLNVTHFITHDFRKAIKALRKHCDTRIVLNTQMTKKPFQLLGLTFIVKEYITIKAIPEQNNVLLVFKVDVCSGIHMRIQTAKRKAMM